MRKHFLKCKELLYLYAQTVSIYSPPDANNFAFLDVPNSAAFFFGSLTFSQPFIAEIKRQNTHFLCYHGKLLSTVPDSQQGFLQVTWYKDGVPMFNSTKFLDSSGIDPKSVFLQHKIEIDKEQGLFSLVCFAT